jgi:molybdate transport system substrate-binding protein
MNKVLRLYLLFSIALSLSTPVMAEEVQVAVASNFTAPIKTIAADFEQQTKHKVLLSFGATGKFYAQIKNGAPYDVLLAADDVIPKKLEQEGAAVAGSRFTYAIGRLVLWSAKADFVDPNVLQRGNFQHIALASPKLAPYGAAAIDVLTHLGLVKPLQAKFVQGENISQTFQFISSGNAELGFVALSQVYFNGSLKSGSAWIIPDQYYSPIRQDAVLLTSAKDKTAAQAFMSYLKSSKAKAVMATYGYRF